MNENLMIIERKINEIVQKLLIPIRVEKTIDKEAFDLFYCYLDELVKIIEGKELIPRKLAGLLFYIYVTLISEIEIDNYKNPIFMEAAKLEGYLDRILWDSPFGNLND